MKKLKYFFCLILSMFLISGCGAKQQSDDACANNNQEIILVTAITGVKDQSFNQSSWEGIQNVCKLNNVGATYIESKSESTLEGDLRSASEKAKIVVVNGFLFEKQIAKVAQEFPEVQYVFIDGEPKNEQGEPVTLPNVYSYFFKEAQGGFLVGYIASKLTKTNKIGFIGGMESPAVQQFGWGYLQGAQAANPNVEVKYEYANSFSDTTAGKNIANAMMSDNVDIIFTAAGETSKGVVKAAIDSSSSGHQVYVIGVDRDMYNEGLYDNDQKSVILTSAIKRVDKATSLAIEKILKNEQEQPITTLTYEEGYVGIPDNNPNLVNDQTIVDEAKQTLTNYINNGTIYYTKEQIDNSLSIKVNGSY